MVLFNDNNWTSSSKKKKKKVFQGAYLILDLQSLEVVGIQFY